MPENVIVTQQAKAKALNELHKIAESSQEVLASASTVFPLDLFPDRVAVDRTQVTIAHRTFLWMGDVTSVRIEDILNVTANVGLIFGSLRISTRFFDPDKPYEIPRLWREDALKLQAIIQGLLIASKKDIDASALEGAELVQEAAKLGQASSRDVQ